MWWKPKLPPPDERPAPLHGRKNAQAAGVWELVCEYGSVLIRRGTGETIDVVAETRNSLHAYSVSSDGTATLVEEVPLSASYLHAVRIAQLYALGALGAVVLFPLTFGLMFLWGHSGYALLAAAGLVVAVIVVACTPELKDPVVERYGEERLWFLFQTPSD
jgi:hypothetical protein